MLFLQTPQKQERQVTPKNTPQKRNDDNDDDDEYGGSTDVDEKGLHQTTLLQVPLGFKSFFISFKIQSTSAGPLQ